jgi:type VI secretion system protein VasG
VKPPAAPARCADRRAAGADCASESDLAILQARFDEEKGLVSRILELRGQLEQGEAPRQCPVEGKKEQASRRTTGNEALDKALLRLRELQGEAPMVPLQVDGHVVAEIIAAWTGFHSARWSRTRSIPSST